MDYSFLLKNRIIPVVVTNSVGETIPKLTALIKGGIKIAEITFRTDCAEEALSLAVKELGNKMFIGAGTVINAEQCEKALSLGAEFIVSPGFSKEVCAVCEKTGAPYIPGVATATEIMAAKACGLSVLKFFPAQDCGGIKNLKALSSAFPDVRFVPTGGVDESNMRDYLSQKFVAAVGGSWMMKGTPKEIETLSALAVSDARRV